MATRQREWQRRRRDEGKCILCGEPRTGNRTYCERHRIEALERSKVYYEAHREKILGRAKAWRDAHPNYARDYYERHRKLTGASVGRRKSGFPRGGKRSEE